MTGVAWILLLIGVVFMIGSFFVTEKLSPSELNQIAELSEEELKRIIDRGLKNAETRIEDAIDEQVDQSSEKVDRSLEKVTNDKIMAISEYSDTVIESMNKTHNEIMFLYSMLNDKHTELTGMAADLQRLAALSAAAVPLASLPVVCALYGARRSYCPGRRVGDHRDGPPAVGDIRVAAHAGCGVVAQHPADGHQPAGIYRGLLRRVWRGVLLHFPAYQKRAAAGDGADLANRRHPGASALSG